MDIVWWAIAFFDGATGYVKMANGSCQGVFRADGTAVHPEEKVEYTCVDVNATAPSWA